MLPRSLHYATQRTQTVRGKTLGRFGRDDTFFTFAARLKACPDEERDSVSFCGHPLTAAVLCGESLLIGVVEKVEGEFGVVAGAGDVDGDYGAGAVFFEEGVG